MELVILTRKMIIRDLIILGRGCPEKIKNGRITVCTAGYSPTHGFIRIYPTRMDMPFKRWDIIKVPVEKNPRDTRRESWKIEGSKTEWDKLDEKIDVIGKFPEEKRLDLISNLIDDCVHVINEQKRSLGIIKPTIEKCYFSEQEDYDASTQLDLLGQPLPKVKEQYPYVPRVKYYCSKCKAPNGHDQQVLEWGFYEWMRKYPDKIDQVWENAKLFSHDYEKFFLVGNLFQYRSRFIIVSIIRLRKRNIAKPLFPLKK